jgi:ubiquinone/menaquinone biosynthesis C-methylase UbiE
MNNAASVFNDGAAYERHMGRWSKLAGREFLDWLAPSHGLSWLDVGCGNGAFTEEIIARCAPAEVVAVDSSENQIVYARERPGAKLADFRVADAQSLPFGSGSFDVVGMGLVISFIPNPAKAIAEMVRVVRPGGSVATYMWDSSIGGLPVDPINRTLRRMGIEPPRAQNSASATLPALYELWTKAGLDAVETKHIRVETIFPAFDEYWDTNTVGVGPQGVLIARMTAETRDHFRNELRREMPPGTNGRITVPAVASAVKGRARIT